MTVAIGATVAVASPATAATQNHQDPRRDVTTLGAKAKPRPGIDVISLRNTHQGKKLKMSLTTATLQNDGYYVQWGIQTPDDASYLLVFDNTTGDPTVQFIPTGSGPVRLPAASRGTQPTCDNADATVDRDTITGTVPASCFGKADEVRVSGAIVSPDESAVKVDDSRRKGYRGGSAKLGPVLERS